MEKTFILSFIIPIYNVEPYLKECIDSILSQSAGQCEVILVDDGSTDGSGDLCDRYARGHDCVTVIHKPNGGLSSARNAGMEAAHGKYLAFVDSDDRIAKGSVQQILKWCQISNTDICFLEAVKFFPDGSKQPLGDSIEPDAVRGTSKEAVFSHLATRPKYPGSACTKLYRTQYLLNHHLWFPKDRRYSEDLGFFRDCLLVAESFDALSIPYYEYRQNREGSITHGVSSKSFFDLTLFVKETAEAATQKKLPDAVHDCVLSFAAYEYSILLWQYSKLAQRDRVEARKFLKEYQWVLRYSRTRKLLMVRMARSVLGINASAKLLDLYMSHR